MWNTQYTASTTVAPNFVWEALAAQHSGTALGPESDTFELHGPLAVGTTLTVTPQGQQPMESVIVALEPGCVYADETRFGDLVLGFRYDLTPLQAGGTEVTHGLTIDGAGADEVGPELGPQISGDFPESLAELFAAAERLAAGGAL